MNHNYHDITSRIQEPPKWWDENAVPRYCDFAPDQASNIYARQVVLMEIACQSCDKRFLVCMSDDNMTLVRGQMTTFEAIEKDAIHYGDPPNTDCCVGTTMNSIPLRIVEAWSKDWKKLFEWERKPEYERAINCEWG